MLGRIKAMSVCAPLIGNNCISRTAGGYNVVKRWSTTHMYDISLSASEKSKSRKTYDKSNTLCSRRVDVFIFENHHHPENQHIV